MSTHIHTAPEKIEMKVGMSPFTLRHDLANSALFTLEAMAVLAADLPRDKVDYNRADLPVDVHGLPVPGNGLSPAETVRSIRDNGSWMVLQGIEHAPAYRHLIDELVDEIARLADVAPSSFSHRVGYGFVTSPGGVTPYHLDSEHNFLLQMSGTKRMTILPAEACTTAEDLEISPSKSRYIEYRPAFTPLAQTFDLGPGDMLCVPFNDPHYVENGDQVSISMGITFHDEASLNQRKVQTVNHIMRRMGLPQPKPGVKPRADKAKAAAYTAVNMVVDPVRKNQKARQFVKRHILRGAALTPGTTGPQPT